MIRNFFTWMLTAFSLFLLGCGTAPVVVDEQGREAVERPIPVAERFAYPVGRSESVTQAKDKKDDWYNALDFREDNHLGEDWNKNSGGNTDCGEPVYSIANGRVTYTADAGTGWGNVIIVTHTLPDGTQVQSLYGHLQEIIKGSGDVKKRELIGKVGNANGKYLCHLHLEIRERHSPSWDTVFVGYSPIAYGWVDPSDFIDQRLGEP